MNSGSVDLKKKLKKKYIYIITVCTVMIIAVLAIRSLSIKKVTVVVDGKEIIHKNIGKIK